MKFESFLTRAQDPLFWEERVVICFQANNYSFSFFYQLFKFLEQKKVFFAPLKKIHTDPFDHKKLVPLLSQGLLGSYHYYWLGDVASSMKEKDAPKAMEFLASNSGPNRIIFFLDDETVSAHKKVLRDIDIITIKSALMLEDFQRICTFFEQNLSEKKQLLVKKIFKQAGTLSLDFACILLGYLDLINVRFVDEFFAYIAPQFNVQPSLALLSENFFSRNAQSFFKTWSVVAGDYSEMFWIAYWSEQIWRAFHVINLMQQQDFSRAKKISYRLPFAFIQRDWKKFKPKQLLLLHEQLYTIDFSLKKGSTFCSLDFFYFTHFHNQAS